MRCPKAKKLISLYVAPGPSWLHAEDRQALEAHMAVCEPCRQDCQESRAAIGMLRECWPISADTAALLQRGRRPERQRASAGIVGRHGASRQVAAWAVAACFVITMLEGWAFLNPGASFSGPERSVAPSGGDKSFVVELAGGGSRILPGSIVQTEAGETKELLLQGGHRIMLNAESGLSIQPLVEMGRAGYCVHLALGEAHVQVEHDGNPFVVKTIHGQAIITGTTFDVKTTVVDTILVVSEGSVRFESEAGAVQVTAGQRSRIPGPSNPPSAPTPCDAAALTAWAEPDQSTTDVARIIQSDDFLPGSPPAVLSPGAEVQTDPDRIDYVRWVEQNDDWFRQQFPWVFRLREALAGEGIEVDYPKLLLQSGAIWQFEYPRADRRRQVEPDCDRLLRAALCYGRDESWLRRRLMLRPSSAPESQPPAEAFDRWIATVESQVITCSPRAGSDVLFDTLGACLYLARTRMLAILTIRHGSWDVAPPVRDEILSLLQEQLQSLGRCASLSYEVSLTWPGVDSCPGSGHFRNLAREITGISAREGRLRSYERVLCR